MKIRHIATTGLAAVALVSAGVAVQAPSAAAEPNRSRSCSFAFQDGRPWVQTGRGEPAVIGGGYADCVPAPEQFHVSLTLEFKKSGSDWVVRGAESDSRIPNPRLNIAAWAPCEPGAWRVVATIWLTEYGEPRQFTDKTPPHILSC
ncbi:hypothetical protein IU450_02425 [Nocardia abscessus]|uniref:hypothetical protein n=1 Tax=Nocardia abscessus TaxID=120957 RepID=UPI0018939D47|nr:hypothetical protein [Nocardia abscessus]MBF6334735.1 hypothetical protein [Nocardia abscessus]